MSIIIELKVSDKATRWKMSTCIYRSCLLVQVPARVFDLHISGRCHNETR